MRFLLCALALSACVPTLTAVPVELDPSNPDAEEAPVPAAAPVAGYACPMHPELVLPGPGQCSKCGLALAGGR